MNEHFASLLAGHDVRTVRGVGFKGFRKGALLREADAAGSDALVTPDCGIEHQQDDRHRALGSVVLRAPSNRVEDHRPLVSLVLQALATLRPGQVVRVGEPGQSSKNPRSSSAR